MLTAQLRAIGNPNEIGNPDEKPASAVVGNLQIKLTESEQTGFVVELAGALRQSRMPVGDDVRRW